jgi:predicted nucleic acid-binding protein
MMLFLDSSALVKFYFKEVGSDSILRRVEAAGESTGVSLLSFAEVHAAIARKRRENQISAAAFANLREQFERDWSNLVEVIDLNSRTMAALPGLVARFPLKAGDAVQLSTALWLNEELKDVVSQSGKSPLEFAVSDQILVSAARACGLTVFNPEEEN